MEETKKLSCIDCNVKKCNVKQNIENHKPYPGFCVSHNMDLKDRQMALDTYLGDEKDLKIATKIVNMVKDRQTFRSLPEIPGFGIFTGEGGLAYELLRLEKCEEVPTLLC